MLSAAELHLFLTSPEACGFRRLPARAFFFPFPDTRSAVSGNWRNSALVKSLDGSDWQFCGFNSPEEAAAAVDGEAAWQKTHVPQCWTSVGFDSPHYTNRQMPFPEMPPEIPAKNPTGLYRREFVIPEEWNNKQIILRFDGAESAFFCRVNKQLVGASKDSRGASEFNITELVKCGNNLLEVMVVKWSDGTWLEDQDYWYLPGLSRPVTIFAEDASYRIADIFAKSLLNTDGSGKLSVEMRLQAPGSLRDPVPVKIKLSLIDAAGSEIWSGEGIQNVQRPTCDMDPDRRLVQLQADGLKITPWNAEAPVLYTLVTELYDPEGNLTAAYPVRIGFRRYEFRDRKLLINGEAVRIIGVNRHESRPVNGRAETLDEVREDLEIMKRFNINAIRTSHYPNAPEFYDLCDELGFYVIDEANIEHHAYYDAFCRDQRFLGSFTDRISRCFERDKNHACVFAWSLGNESGEGENHAAGAAYLRYRDDSRLIHYEASCQEPFVGAWQELPPNKLLTDIIAPMYPRFAQIRNWAEHVYDERPFIMCEYSHAMGNSNGGLAEYFDLFENLPGVQGGFIWEWCDHGIPKKFENGKTGYGYGGNFGDEPNDRNFCIDGLVWPDRKPHPGLYEYKHLARPVRAAWKNQAAGTVVLENRRYFTGVEDLELFWQVMLDGREIVSGSTDLPATSPRSTAEITLPLPELPAVLPGTVASLRCEFRLKAAAGWAEAGHIVAEETLPLEVKYRETAADVPQQTVSLTAHPDRTTISTGTFTFDVAAEGMRNASADGVEIIRRGPRPALWRAATDNDGLKLMPLRKIGPLFHWKELGYDRIRIVSDRFNSGSDRVSTHALAIAPGIKEEELEFTQEYLPCTDGAIEYRASFLVPPAFEDLPRLGISMELAGTFTNVEYSGRGPGENYPDRCAAAAVGVFRDTVDNMYTPYIMPQENGGRCGCSFVALRDDEGRGILICTTQPEGFFFTASRFGTDRLYSSLNEAELVPDRVIHLNIDARHRGIGTASCGEDTLECFKIPAGTVDLKLIMIPLNPGDEAADTAREAAFRHTAEK